MARSAADEAAFAELVRRHRRPLRQHAARYVGEADAEDVVQVALVNASLALRREPRRDVEPRPWLYKITTNAAIDHRRARAVRPLGDRPFTEPEVDRVVAALGSDPHDVLSGREEVRSVVSGIQGLSPNQRHAASARFLEGRSHEEIAAELGVSRAAARELIRRARRTLRDGLPALSPLPFLGRLRDAIGGLFAGSSVVPAAKIAAGVAAVAVVAGAGGAALKSGGGSESPRLASEAPGSSSAAAGVVVPSLPPVAVRPRGNGSRAGSGGRDAGAGQGPAAVAAGAGGASDAGGGTAGGEQPQGSQAAAPSGSPDDAVKGLADDLGVGQIADELGLPPLTRSPSIGGLAEGLGIKLPDLPGAGAALGGN